MSVFSPLFARGLVRRMLLAAACAGVGTVAVRGAGAQEAAAKAPEAVADLAGKVTDSTGAPLSKAMVYVYTAAPRVGSSPFCPSCYADCGKHETTDGKGGFRLPALSTGLIFRLLVVEDGYEPQFVSKIDPLKGPIQVTLKKEAANSHDPKLLVRGRITDPTGKPVAGATLEPNAIYQKEYIRFGGIPGVTPLVVTNARGEFQFDCPTGTRGLTALVKARGLAPCITPKLIPGAAKRQGIAMGNGTTVMGAVRDSAGKGLAGVTVELVPVDRNAETFTGWEEIGTDQDGKFTLPNVPANRKYVVCVRMDSLAEKGLGTGRQTIATGPDDTVTEGVHPTVQTAATITGHVVTLDGKPIRPGTRIMLGRAETWDVQQAILGTDGSFTFQGVPQDEAMELILQTPGYHIAPDSPGYDKDQGQVTFKVPAGTRQTEIPIRLAPGAK